MCARSLRRDCTNGTSDPSTVRPHVGMRARVIACSQVEVDVLGSIERVISGESIKRGIVGSLRAARATRNSIQDERNGD